MSKRPAALNAGPLATQGVALGAAVRRPVCARCERPVRTCLCEWVCSTDNRVAVHLWMHPDEVGQAKGSATLLRLSLARCALHVNPGDALSAPLPEGWLDAGAALLYPDEHGDAAVADPSQVRRLIVLDGSWRQSRQMLRAQPALAQLPRLSLPPDLLAAHGQRYRVRKAHKPGQLSTLEAVVLALRHLEQAAQQDAACDDAPTRDRHGLLLQAFDGWIDSLAAWARPALSPAPPTSASPAG